MALGCLYQAGVGFSRTMVLCPLQFALGKQEDVTWLSPAHPQCQNSPSVRLFFPQQTPTAKFDKNNYLAINWLLAYELEFNI